MAYELREGQGSLFKNDKAGDNPKAPGYTGTALIGGVEYRISAWVKDGRNGKFFSLNVQPKGERAPQSRAPKEAPQADFDDPVPF